MRSLPALPFLLLLALSFFALYQGAQLSFSPSANQVQILASAVDALAVKSEGR